VSFVGADEEREEFRVRYPVSNRPTFGDGAANSLVIDLSVTGFRIATPLGKKITSGQSVRGTLKLLSGTEHVIHGTVARVTRDQMVVSFLTKLPFGVILGEERHLAEQYPARRKTPRRYVEGAPTFARALPAAQKNSSSVMTHAAPAGESPTTADVIILAMASLAEARDNETGSHLQRVQGYVRALAESLRHHPRFTDHLAAEAIDAISRSAPIHDIGKVGIPDRILLKQDKLDEEEWEVMKTHPVIGFDALESAERALGMQSDFLRYAKEIALFHQERWDGSGYPQGLAGDDIPVSARLMAVADVYDALISKRPYNEPMRHTEAVKFICAEQGRLFDPDIVDAFLSIHEQFEAIANAHAE
jgi:response regulator RpfG family c-di-GMP phosphodiesterase